MTEILAVLGFIALIVLAAMVYHTNDKLRKLKKHINNIYLESAGDSRGIYKRIDELDCGLNNNLALTEKINNRLYRVERDKCDCKEFCKKENKNKETKEVILEELEKAEELVKIVEKIKEDLTEEEKPVKPKRTRSTRKK